MSLFDCSYSAELLSKFVESLFVSLLSHAVVHISPLSVLALSGVQKIFFSRSKLAKRFEPKLCVLLLVLGGFQEKRSYLLISCFLGNACEICIFVSCL